MSISPVKTADIHFDPSGAPVSSHFEDFYFSTDNGLQETQHVFINANHLPQRWLDHDGQTFVIGETGFGTGLNFLATLRTWLDVIQNQSQNQSQSQSKNPNDSSNKQLHFISFEKYPLTYDDLKKSLAQWPILADLTTQLLAQYPPALPGCHRLTFNQNAVAQSAVNQSTVILDLWFGDIKDTLPQLFRRRHGTVDAWYLDGFSPGKNADMWSPEIYQAMMILSKPGATLATFTAASMVRKGLIAAGFNITKIVGFGKKREMLTGQVLDKPEVAVIPPFYYRHDNTSINAGTGKNVAIIGGGIASATLCYSLAKRGYDITLFCKDNALAQGASQNKQAALYPLLHADYDSLSEFYCHAYLYALRLYHDLLQKNHHFEHSFCGVLLQAFNDKVKQRQQSLIDNNLWPELLLRPVDATQASSIAGIGLTDSGLYFPAGGWINPGSLIDALLNAAKQLTTVDIQLNHEITSLSQRPSQQPSQSKSKSQNHSQGWQINQSATVFDQMVVCSGHLAGAFEQTKQLSLAPIRGQVSHMDSTEQTEKLATVLCYSGYLTPLTTTTQKGEKPAKQQHCLGASFIKGDDSTEPRAIEHQKNRQRLAQCLGHHHWFDDLPVPTEGKAAIRCASIDHLPLVGAVPDYQQYANIYQDLWKGLRPHHYQLPPDYDNLYILTALGARGLCSAPLSAEILAAQINNEPYPVSTRVLNALNPGRGYVKRLKTRGAS